MRLKWHYRSEHESLIRFSNEEYYSDDPLYTFPHAGGEDEELGLQFELVPGATYDGGGVNVLEAEAVADAVVAHIYEAPELTLGVGTFGIKQQTRILDALDERRRADPAIEPFFHREGEERFFVKNLENIQGDTRDVIFLSVTYGKDRFGRVHRRFGPLNQSGGWRRLNVITTRARKRVRVFSSMRADDIDLSGSLSRGAQDLYNYLKYAETGVYPHSKILGLRPESPFEFAVIAELERRDYQVVPQVGEGGYRIDIGVLAPEFPGRFICGVECDGATYHSALTVRDRDRLREHVLELRGWELHRVWSTDWFNDRAGQIDRLVRLIEGSRERVREGHRPEPRLPTVVVTAAETQETTGSTPDVIRAKPEIDAIPISPYGFATKSDARKSGDFYLADDQRLEIDIEHILRIEAPIHRDELARRIAEFWSMQRAGRRIVARVEGVLQGMETRRVVRLRGKFVWLAEQEKAPVRSRDVPGVSFQAEHIAPEEVGAAMCLLLTHRAPVLPADLTPETTRLFGFRRTGAHLRALFDRVKYHLLDSGEIELSTGGLKLTGQDLAQPRGVNQPGPSPTQVPKAVRTSHIGTRLKVASERPRGGSRPYFKSPISALEVLVEGGASDVQLLRIVLDELVHRSTNRAENLRMKVARLLRRAEA